MANAISGKDLKDADPEVQARKSRRQWRHDTETSFEGKAFDSLTGAEKDDLLKALAIEAGIISE
jgi:hypothetical protein